MSLATFVCFVKFTSMWAMTTEKKNTFNYMYHNSTLLHALLLVLSSTQ